MKQYQIITALKNFFPIEKGINSAILYGSFARGEANPNSDIDIQLLVNKSFDSNRFMQNLKELSDFSVLRVQEVKLRNKIVVYLKDLPKIELAVHKKVEELERNYLGSEIKDIEASILFQREEFKTDLVAHFKKLIQNKKEAKINQQAYISDLIDKFVYEFENCSTMHKRSDGYQFYFFYNIALNVVVQLKQLAMGDDRFNFFPKRIIPQLPDDTARENFYALSGSLFLPNANKIKRNLLDYFYETIQTLVAKEQQNELKSFCEKIYERDFFWNFRDPNQNNPKFKPGKVFRTATLTYFQQEPRFENLLESKTIKTIIDLRADREVDESKYEDKVLSKFNYVYTPWDPWNQPDWFKEKYHFGSNADIAYRFFILGCKPEIKKAMEAIIETDGAVAVHCFAGKDRTGIFISLLHLLIESDFEDLMNDYLASEVDVKPERLRFVLDIVEEQGGIEEYLKSCKLSQDQISNLKKTLTHEY